MEYRQTSYAECDIESYMFVATLDLRTSDVCASLDGQVFRVKDVMPGKNMPPMHPWCRSTTIEYVSPEALSKMKRRARDPITGKNIIVPADMKYEEWYKKFVEGNEEAIVKEKVVKRSYDIKQYARYKDLLKDLAPDNVEDFIKLKYNDIEVYKQLQKKYCIVNKYSTVIGNMYPGKIIELHKANTSFKKNFIGKQANPANAATVQFNNIEMYALSRANTKNDYFSKLYKGKQEKLIIKSDNPMFNPYKVNGFLRDCDSEYKILEYLNIQEINTEINMISGYPMCDSCLNVMKEFLERNPNVSLNIIEGKRKR